MEVPAKSCRETREGIAEEAKVFSRGREATASKMWGELPQGSPELALNKECARGGESEMSGQ